MSDALHHLNKRKRVHTKELEPYPHPRKFKAFVDHAVYAAGILGPMFGALQVYKIWSTQNASGVSLSLFGSHVVFNIIWLIYGTLHKEKPIIIMYSLWIVVNTLVVIGTLLYS
ncbi:hypothetical protein C0581_00785 [Candidatus Parcubacteria bacterium]|nr:MAG: hypothetical protein C0581_00785 [Candidatus Parcubacteria bacterium]